MKLIKFSEVNIGQKYIYRSSTGAYVSNIWRTKTEGTKYVPPNRLVFVKESN